MQFHHGWNYARNHSQISLSLTFTQLYNQLNSEYNNRMDIPELGKAIATVGMWIGVGIVAAFSPEFVEGVAGSAAIATVLMWLFG